MAEREAIGIRIDSELKREWDVLCAKKRITQQAALEELLTWFMKQNDLLQSVIFKQNTPTPDLMELVLKNMQETALPKPKPSDVSVRQRNEKDRPK